MKQKPAISRHSEPQMNAHVIGLDQRGTTSFWNVPKIILNDTDLYVFTGTVLSKSK